MRYIKRFNESKITIFDKKIKGELPKNIEIYTTNGTFQLKIGDFTREDSIIRCTWNYSTFNKTNDALIDGEPDFVGMDIHFTKNNKKLKMLVDITYGDSMISEFSIEDNKVKVGHYNGYNSKFDKDTHFGFGDKTLKEFITFFNSFGFKLSEKDFTFIDKYPDSYKTESIKLTPLLNNKVVAVFCNNKDINYRNLIKYLQNRGIENISVENEEELDDKKVRGIITFSKLDFNKFNCPVIAIGDGFYELCKYYGSSLKSCDFIHNNNIIKDFTNSKLFNNISFEKTQLSFSFKSEIDKCPKSFKVIAKLEDRIVAVSNEEENKYGILFHPQNIEYSYNILDNFIKLCSNTHKDVEKLKIGKFNEELSEDEIKFNVLEIFEDEIFEFEDRGFTVNVKYNMNGSTSDSYYISNGLYKLTKNWNSSKNTKKSNCFLEIFKLEDKGIYSVLSPFKYDDFIIGQLKSKINLIKSLNDIDFVSIHIIGTFDGSRVLNLYKDKVFVIEDVDKLDKVMDFNNFDITKYNVRTIIVYFDVK